MEIRVPEVGESIVEALVAKWHRKNGAQVRKEDPLCELETDKVTLEINADANGILTILVPEGKTVTIGTVIATIRETEIPIANQPALSPAARKLAREKAVEPETIKGSGKKGRILAEDLLKQQDTSERTDTATPAPPNKSEPEAASTEPAKQPSPSTPVRMAEPPTYLTQKERPVTRKAMTPIRKRIAERLLDARQQTAMVTTFKEVDMGRVIALRRKYKDFFQQHHGVSLGYMPFFVKACVEALQDFSHGECPD